MTSADQLFFTIVSTTVIIPLLAMVLFFKITNKSVKSIFPYIALLVVGEIAGHLTSASNNMYIIASFSILEVFAIGTFFWYQGLPKNFLAVGSFIVLAFYTYDTWIVITASGQLSLSRAVAYGWYTLLGIVCIHKLMKNMQIYRVIHEPAFIIAVGLMSYFTVEILFIALKPAYMQYSTELIINIFKIKGTLSILSRIIITLGIWKVRSTTY